MSITSSWTMLKETYNEWSKDNATLVLLLVWVYYAAQILFFGAEFTQVWSRRRGTPIQPTPTARLTE